MKPLKSLSRTATGLLAAAVALLAVSCSGNGASNPDTTSSAASAATTKPPAKNITITVAYHYASPPPSALASFTKETGITVDWQQVGFTDLQAKIIAAGQAGSYFADVTDVDWSNVGDRLQQGYLTPLDKYFDVQSLKSDMPPIESFVRSGKLLGVPFDSSFLITTVNKKAFTNAGIAKLPTTIDELMTDLQTLQDHGMQHPLNISYKAGGGISQCWLQLSEAFGGSAFDTEGKPQFSSPSSPGYKALEFLVNAFKTGLVAPGALNQGIEDGETSVMAQNRAAVTLCDFSGSVASIYNDPKTSTVADQVAYIPVPGTAGPAPSVQNPDGLAIPAAARNKDAAATFIKWLTSTENQAKWAGLDGSGGVIAGFPSPARTSAITLLEKSAPKSAQTDALAAALASSVPMVPGGAPVGFAGFQNTAETDIHAAVAGSMSVPDAVNDILKAAETLK